MRSLSRRDIFPALGATALAGIAAAGLAKPETLTAAPIAKPEGKSPSLIMAAYYSYFEADAAIDSISTEPRYPFGSYEDDEQMERAGRHVDQRQRALETLGSSACSTKEELRAKANVLLHHLPDAIDAFALDRESEEIKLALSVAADAVRFSWQA
ncbi:hypothetical protein AD947_16140 [Acetobacter tropicalis]|uniref:Uncharacterized protein n=1 Tax=Acetobacter tropicalis TaxID=104102 RepID=A0A149TQK8_9PROT|nr:hypothetical protein AD947_16140 [Acetobacter tropicalis]